MRIFPIQTGSRYVCGKPLLNGISTDPKIAAVKGGGVGHASLQAPGEYLSHWPGEVFDLVSGGVVGGAGVVSTLVVVARVAYTIFLAVHWFMYGMAMALYGLALPLLIFSPSKFKEIYSKLPEQPPELKVTEYDFYKNLILFCAGVLGTMYGSGKMLEGSYKTFQKLIVTTPQNVAKLTQSAVNMERNPYFLDFIPKSSLLLKKQNPTENSGHQRVTPNYSFS